MNNITSIQNQINFKEEEINSIESKIKEYKDKFENKRELNEREDQSYYMMISWKQHLENELKKLMQKDKKKEENIEKKYVPESNKSIQMELFKNFVAPKNDDSVLSNLIHLWDLTPKYYISKRQTAKMIKENKVVKGKETIVIGGDKIDIEIKPASIEVNGNLKPHFPSDDEELIESVLRKIFLVQGIHVVKPADSWVKYSKRVIQKELKKIGKTRSSNEITKSLEIMLQCNILIKRNGQVVHNAGILLNQVDKGNQAYNNSPDMLSAVQLPQFLSFCINKIEYRQHNQYLTDSLKTQIARWISKRMTIEFINADHSNHYAIKYSHIVEDSCLLKGTKYKNIIKIDKAITNMINIGILSKSHDTTSMKNNIYKNDSKTIVDIEYKLVPSSEFIMHMKASNKREKDLKLVRNS